MKKMCLMKYMKQQLRNCLDLEILFIAAVECLSVAISLCKIATLLIMRHTTTVLRCATIT